MYILISPAKTLDFTQKFSSENASLPVFEKKASQIVKTIKKLKASDLMQLMSISNQLAQVNFDRFQQWGNSPNSAKKEAIFAFRGDVYQGLEAGTLDKEALEYAQAHLRILSGLYGLLRPLDLIEPYRLEMGTSISIGKSDNLYEFWKTAIKNQVKEDMKAIASDTILNLASNEYFKSVAAKDLNKLIISPVFKDYKNGDYKIISFYAKKARGLMTRYLLQNQSEDPSIIVGFRDDGYVYNPSLSSETSPVFTRG
ncbi:MAG: peroxide stress protein YaaA [Bacteroidetes bacterium]|jgi:cytoplasmic iron level regulating protein YaaA (DUF328/UPF0246 family)|nr:peroxide stress protein YaaA [Bacteroidota bacterium]